MSLRNGLSAFLSALPKGIAQAGAYIKSAIRHYSETTTLTSSKLASTVYGGPPKVS